MVYFTFSMEGQLFERGWIEIKADTISEAREKFVKKYKDRAFVGKSLNFAFPYTKEEFDRTGMKEEGNFGAYCHETIE